MRDAGGGLRDAGGVLLDAVRLKGLKLFIVVVVIVVREFVWVFCCFERCIVGRTNDFV